MKKTCSMHGAELHGGRCGVCERREDVTLAGGGDCDAFDEGFRHGKAGKRSAGMSYSQHPGKNHSYAEGHKEGSALRKSKGRGSSRSPLRGDRGRKSSKKLDRVDQVMDRRTFERLSDSFEQLSIKFCTGKEWIWINVPLIGDRSQARFAAREYDNTSCQGQRYFNGHITLKSKATIERDLRTCLTDTRVHGVEDHYVDALVAMLAVKTLALKELASGLKELAEEVLMATGEEEA